MFLEEFKQIEALSHQAAKYTQSMELSLCQKNLSQRQSLLESVVDKIAHCSSDKNIEKIKKTFHDLLILIQGIDQQAIKHCNTLKSTQKEKILHQKKTTKAIDHYLKAKS